MVDSITLQFVLGLEKAFNFPDPLSTELRETSRRIGLERVTVMSQFSPSNARSRQQVAGSREMKQETFSSVRIAIRKGM